MEIVPQSQNQIQSYQVLDKERVDLIKRTIAKGATLERLAMRQSRFSPDSSRG